MMCLSVLFTVLLKFSIFYCKACSNTSTWIFFATFRITRAKFYNNIQVNTFSCTKRKLKMMSTTKNVWSLQVKYIISTNDENTIFYYKSFKHFLLYWGYSSKYFFDPQSQLYFIYSNLFHEKLFMFLCFQNTITVDIVWHFLLQIISIPVFQLQICLYSSAGCRNSTMRCTKFFSFSSI